MDKEVKTRLRALTSILNISNLDIAEKTGYTANMVSKSLNPKYDVLTIKFVNRFFDSFPEVKKEYRQWVIEGIGNSPISVNHAKVDNLFNSDARVQMLEQKNSMLEEQLKLLREDLNYFKSLLQQAYKIYPELPAKLTSPLAQEESMGLVDMPLGMLTSPLGTKQGAFA